MIPPGNSEVSLSKDNLVLGGASHTPELSAADRARTADVAEVATSPMFDASSASGQSRENLGVSSGHSRGIGSTLQNEIYQALESYKQRIASLEQVIEQ
mmetsp:Transcript_24216/g.32457  ORF Transcript_24216/g.32457 Transcript_24216/m.32457 type:complete len:99 (+) Transcript_24216:464-760(+)